MFVREDARKHSSLSCACVRVCVCAPPHYWPASSGPGPAVSPRCSAACWGSQQACFVGCRPPLRGALPCPSACWPPKRKQPGPGPGHTHTYTRTHSPTHGSAASCTAYGQPSAGLLAAGGPLDSLPHPAALAATGGAGTAAGPGVAPTRFAAEAAGLCLQDLPPCRRSPVDKRPNYFVPQGARMRPRAGCRSSRT